MRKLGLQGVRRTGKRVVTTVPDWAATSYHRPPDMVKRQFVATAPNQLWVVDFCYVMTEEGVAYCAFVQDVFARRIVGWRISRRMPTELPLDALNMALWVRDKNNETVIGLRHHSDAGSQYTSYKYMTRLAEVGLIASIGTVGDSYDNAMAESLNGLYKAECTKLEGPWRTVKALELATSDWVDYWNNNRIHSAIGYVTPAEYEEMHYTQQQAQQQPALTKS